MYCSPRRRFLLFFYADLLDVKGAFSSPARIDRPLQPAAEASRCRPALNPIKGKLPVDSNPEEKPIRLLEGCKAPNGLQQSTCCTTCVSVGRPVGAPQITEGRDRLDRVYQTTDGGTVRIRHSEHSISIASETMNDIEHKPTHTCLENLACWHGSVQKESIALHKPLPTGCSSKNECGKLFLLSNRSFAAWDPFHELPRSFVPVLDALSGHKRHHRLVSADESAAFALDSLLALLSAHGKCTEDKVTYRI